MAFDATSFTQIPLTTYRPGPRVEFDFSKLKAGLPRPKVRVLVAGQKLNTGTAAAGVAVRVLSLAHAKQLFGIGSQLAGMFLGWFDNDPGIEVWGIGLSDNGGGTASAGTYAITGPATAAGTLALMVCDQSVLVPVSSGMTATQIGTAAAAAINAYTDLPATAASVSGTVTVTCRHKGAHDAALHLDLNYHPGEVLPAGVGVVVTDFTGGTTNPDANTVVTAIGDSLFQYIVHPWTDATNIAVFEAALADRATAGKMNYGLALTVMGTNTYSTATTAAAARNSQYHVFASLPRSPSPAWRTAGALGAQVAGEATRDPARPFNTLVLKGILSPNPADLWDNTECEGLLVAGAAPLVADGGENVEIMRLVTSYKTNAAGQSDDGLKDANSILTLYYLSWSLQDRIATAFPRCKLADDGTNFDPGTNVVTPRMIKAQIAALARTWERAGLIEHYDDFVATLVVQRDANDKNRVNVFLRPDLINGLHVTAALIQPAL